MNKKLLRLKFVTVILTALAAASFSILPAQAYYWGYGYSPYSGLSNWAWMAQSLAYGYPYNRYSGYSGYSGYYWPSLASSLLWNASYYASRGLQNGQIYNQRNTYNGDYVYGDPYYGNIYQPRPFVGQAAQQMVYGRRLNGYTNWSGMDPTYGYTGQYAPAPNYTPPTQSYTPPVQNYTPDPLPISQNGSGWSSSSSGLSAPPEVAPAAIGSNYAPDTRTDSRHAGRNKRSNRTGNVSSPMASGFVDLVNNKYDGDIGKALQDSQTRSYAKAVGLLNDADAPTDLGPERVQLIRQILADHREDPASRVAAARMLLAH